jgi:F0F1-type ATP synthase assembly protein I
MGIIREKLEWADKLSLGISVVVAILMGVGLGLWLKSIFHRWWLVALGTFWGIAAAFLNIKRAYQKLKRELEEEAEKYRKSYTPFNSSSESQPLGKGESKSQESPTKKG